MLGDAAGLFRALGIEDVLICGASAGGIVAFQVAIRHHYRYGKPRERTEKPV